MYKYEVNEEFTEGVFISEDKGRFSCEVKIGNEIQKCYVPSSAKLGQFINLKNKKVLLSHNNNTSKTAYTLWSVSYRQRQVLLNLKRVNEIIEQFIDKSKLLEINYDSIQREKVLENYKCDLLLSKENVKVLVEIKTVISTKREAYFPGANTERAVEQLVKLRDILRKGYKVKYIIVSLSPFVKSIELNNNYEVYKNYFIECVDLGMEVIKLKLEYKDNLITYSRL